MSRPDVMPMFLAFDRESGETLETFLTIIEASEFAKARGLHLVGVCTHWVPREAWDALAVAIGRAKAGSA